LISPTDNESKNFSSLISKNTESAKEAGFSSSEFNLVVVNNGSVDNSSHVLKELKNSELGDWFRVVEVKLNQGYGFGIWSGLQETSATVVGWSHADLQCDPANAFKALRILSESNSKKVLVKGTRIGRNWKDIVVSRVFETIARVILNLKTYEVNAQPKVFYRDLLVDIVNPPKTFAFDLYVLYRAQKIGYGFKNIEVFFPPRIHGVSNWASTLLGRYKTILNMIKYILQLAKTEGRL